jgi:hypothetical protein
VFPLYVASGYRLYYIQLLYDWRFIASQLVLTPKLFMANEVEVILRLTVSQYVEVSSPLWNL